MLSLPGYMPPGSLLDADLRPLTKIVTDAGGLWFSFDSALATVQDGAITALAPRTGPIHARPTEANTANARLVRHRGAEALVTTPRTNCGFVLEQRVSCAGMGIALVFEAPSGAGETLLCVDAKEGDSGIVLVERGGAVHLTDRGGEAMATRPLTPGAMQVIFATVTPDICTLLVGEATAVVALPGRFRAGEADVYLACRRGRAGLKNTLGDLRLADVVLFPDTDICAPEATPMRARLHRYCTEVFHGI